MHVDFKITTWERHELPDDLTPKEIAELERKITEGIITCHSDLEEEVGDVNWEILAEAEEYMTPDENDGQATIEFHMENGQTTPTITNTD